MGASSNTINAPVKKVRTRLQREARIAYWIIIPIFSYIAFWNLIPLILGVLMGFTEFNALRPPTWVGLHNYNRFFTTGIYTTLLWRQIWLGGLCLIINTVLSFFVGLALNVKSRARGFFRACVYVPAVAAVSVTTAVFVALLDPVSGGANRFLVSLGMDPVIWNHSQFWMAFWIVVFFVWRSLGTAAIIWLGGLQGIDPSQYEAAKVDGASFWQQVLYITIPGLRFVSAFIILTGIISVMQMFDVVMFISRGNPFGQTDILMYRIFRDGTVNFNLGMAGASSTVLGIFTMFFAVLYFTYMTRREEKMNE